MRLCVALHVISYVKGRPVFAAIKFHDYAMAVAGSTVQRDWRYLLSPFNSCDLRNTAMVDCRNSPGSKFDKSRLPKWNVLLDAITPFVPSVLPFGLRDFFFRVTWMPDPYDILIRISLFVDDYVHRLREIREKNRFAAVYIHRPFALRHRFLDRVRTSCFPSEFLSDACT